LPGVRVTIYAMNGREIASRDLDKGASFGELSAIDGRSRSTSVIALDDSSIAAMPREQFRDLLRVYPAVAENVMKTLVSLVRSLTERVVEYSTLGVRYRIQAELARLAYESGVKDNRSQISPGPKHADLASRISTNREEVTREFGRLSRQGIIERRGRNLMILDVRRLAGTKEKRSRFLTGCRFSAPWPLSPEISPTPRDPRRN
jgi:CRP-like cAMP-binding protein